MKQNLTSNSETIRRVKNTLSHKEQSIKNALFKGGETIQKHEAMNKQSIVDSRSESPRPARSAMAHTDPSRYSNKKGPITKNNTYSNVTYGNPTVSEPKTIGKSVHYKTSENMDYKPQSNANMNVFMDDLTGQMSKMGDTNLSKEMIFTQNKLLQQQGQV